MLKGTTIDPRTGESIEIIVTDKCCKPECNVEVIWVKGIEVPNAVPRYPYSLIGRACCREHTAYYCSKCEPKKDTRQFSNIHSYATKIGKEHLTYRIRDIEHKPCY